MGRAQLVLERLLERGLIPSEEAPDADDPSTDDLVAHIDGNVAEIRIRPAVREATRDEGPRFQPTGQVVGRASAATWD